jgi:hypothetical protein
MQTQDIHDLVSEVLNTMPELRSGDITDQVCLAIETEPMWMNRYEQLVASYGKHTVNQLIGKYTFYLSGFNKSGPSLKAKSEIIKTFSWLS